MKNQEKQQEFKKTIDFVEIKLGIYKERLAFVKGKKAPFVFKVSDALALKAERGVCVLCSPAEATLFNKDGIKQINEQANFKDFDGNPIKPFGAVLAETYFSEMVKEAEELLQLLKQSFDSLEEAER